MAERPKLGVSACLMGEQVRFDGGHKRDRWISEQAGQFFHLLQTCPEMAIGLGVPRPTIQLRKVEDEVRLVSSRDPALDYTAQMRAFAQRQALEFADLDGMIVKKGSPSCGMERVAVVINAQGYRARDGVGVFTATLREALPLLPIEEEGRLNDLMLRENFFQRVYALRRWKEIPDPQHNIQGFSEFHRNHKLMLMARGAEYYRELGQLVAATSREDLARHRPLYIARFMEIMAITSTKGRTVNVLQHIMGYFKQHLSAGDKAELLDLFEAYRCHRVPLGTPITLLRHHLRHHPDEWLESQYFLHPYPEELLAQTV